MKQVIIDIEKFKLGFQALDDTTKAPIGSARIMRNMQITDRGGIAPREGTELLGSNNSSSSVIRGLYNFRKSYDADEFLVKAYDDELEVYSKNHSGAGWSRLKDGYTSGKEFGFVTSLVNTDNEDYLIGCNRYEPYFRWTGAATQLNGALAGGETAVTVDSVLTEEIYESKTATASSATTLTVADAGWATSMWVNFYVYIPSTGKVRKITANNGTVITFDTLGADPGLVAFQIRKLAFPPTGSIIYDGTVIAYTSIDVATAFVVTSAHAGSDNALVMQIPTEYAGNPRGNRLTNFLNRIIVGNVRSALARDSGGALQGFSSGGSYFVSKLNTPTDFTYSASRVAGEGDIISTPYGGGEITDVQHQEEEAYVFKNDYIESVKYSQDSNDLAVRTPLKPGTGSVGKTIKGSDDIYFITKDKKFTSIGRVRAKDLKPQTENLGYVIKRFLDSADVGDIGRGGEWKDKIYIPIKETSAETQNNVTLVFNKNTGTFEGLWDIPAFAFEEFDGGFYFAESNGANVHELFSGEHADIVGSTRYPIVAEYATHFMNLTSSKSSLQAMNALFVEGYIRGGTEVTFKLWKDFATDPFLQFDFSAEETGLLDGQEVSAFLGGAPLALSPLGAVGEADSDGRRHFSFTVYFPFQYGNFFSFGFLSNGVELDYEITRFGLGVKEDVSVDTRRIKSV